MATWGSPLSLKGVKGDPGLSVLSGSGAPGSSLGYDGQVYVDTAAGALYARSNGSWSLTKSLVGPMGLNGVSGSLFSGTAVPDSTVYSGSGSALYVRANGEVYLYAGNGTWTDTNENLTGPQGPAGASVRGSQIFTGSGAPSSNLSSYSNANVSSAAAGDLYLDTGTAGGPFLYVLGS